MKRNVYDVYDLNGTKLIADFMESGDKESMAKARGAYDATRIEAWNECISKILGGSNE